MFLVVTVTHFGLYQHTEKGSKRGEPDHFCRPSSSVMDLNNYLFQDFPLAFPLGLYPTMLATNKQPPTWLSALAARSRKLSI